MADLREGTVRRGGWPAGRMRVRSPKSVGMQRCGRVDAWPGCRRRSMCGHANRGASRRLHARGGSGVCGCLAVASPACTWRFGRVWRLGCSVACMRVDACAHMQAGSCALLVRRLHTCLKTPILLPGARAFVWRASFVRRMLIAEGVRRPSFVWRMLIAEGVRRPSFVWRMLVARGIQGDSAEAYNAPPPILSPLSCVPVPTLLAVFRPAFTTRRMRARAQTRPCGRCRAMATPACRMP
eukprot:364718-Chlamydomonas_euryale.AAC.3